MSFPVDEQRMKNEICTLIFTSELFFFEINEQCACI